MPTLATLALFPPYSLDTSILVAVLIGVILLAFFTETFGWVFVGLVVPGYLASVFAVHPETGISVVVEAVVTYLFATLLSKALSRTGAWSEFFGRDRFFVVLLASVLVREVFELWLLPALGEWSDQRHGTTFTVDHTLHSVGLVLVPLTANAFWKLGLRRGILQTGVPVLLTYGILQFILLPTTNLSFSSLELMYEDIARSFLVSPKAYIVLLVTAALAARFNLRYGWDFNGILVPALIALTWLSPSKLVATLAEVAILVLLTKAVLTLPGIRTLNLEGARKTVLVFVLGFAVKWAMGWALGGRVPGLKVTDLFGFGYLVPTLLAVKILQKQVSLRISLAAVHTSLAGFAIGSLLGFDLSFLEPKQVMAAPPTSEQASPSSWRLGRTPLGAMALARAAARETDRGGTGFPTRRKQLRDHRELWERIDRWVQTASPEDLAQVRAAAAPVGLELTPFAEDSGAPGTYLLTERGGLAQRVGWGTALLTPKATGPVLLVPRPVSEPPSAEASVALCARVSCRAILVSGIDTLSAGSRRGDALTEENLPFQAAHQALSAHPRVVVRADPDAAPGKPTVHSLSALPLLDVLWPGADRSRDWPREGGLRPGEQSLAVLRANPEDLLSLVGSTGPALSPPIEISDLLSALSQASTMTPGPRQRLSETELIILDRQVAAPLLGPAAGPSALRWSTTMAELFGLTISPVSGCASDGICVLLIDAPGSTRRVGTALLLRTAGAPLGIEVARPWREPGTLPFGLELWHQGRARALLVGEDSEELGRREAMDREVDSAFQAIHQALQRALPPEEGLVAQLRGFSSRPATAGSAAIISLERPVLESDDRLPQLDALLKEGGPLACLGPTARYYDGAEELAFVPESSAQQLFARTFGGAPVATLWLSDGLRGRYVPGRLLAEQLASLGKGPQVIDPATRLGLATWKPLRGPPSQVLQRKLGALRAQAERFLSEQNPHQLRALLSRKGGGVELAMSAEHGLPYLLLSATHGRQSARALYFLSDLGAAASPVELVPGTEDFRARAAKSLRERRPLIIQGEVGVEEARR